MHGSLRPQGATMVDEVALDLLKGVVEKSKDKARSEIFDQFERALSRSSNAQREVHWYFFLNMYQYLTSKRNETVSLDERVERAIERRTAVENIKSQIVLMKLMLPSGKLVAEAKFADMAKAGGWFAKAAKLGKPNQVVGKTITEAQLKKCL